jgi:beta-galactosidase
LAEALGGHVEEFYALENEVAVQGTLGEGKARVFAEWLAMDAAGGEPLLAYSGQSWLDKHAAFLSRPCGWGRLSYLGAWLDDALMARVMTWATRAARVRPPAVAALPAGVEFCRRQGPSRELVFLINHTAQPQTCRLAGPKVDVMSGEKRGPELTLEPRAVLLLAPPAEEAAT